MTIKLLKILLILLLSSCGRNNQLPTNLKKRLLDFNVSKSSVTLQLKDTNNKKLEFGTLFGGFNKINIKTSQDTIFADVNIELSQTLNYEGGCEFKADTLFLYAKNLDKETKETIHSTLTYKIFAKGQEYKEIIFKELK